MVRIRLFRMGKKKKPYYRIVVTDSRNPRDGKYIEAIGYYHPVEGEGVGKLFIDLDKLDLWLKRGAQMSDTVEKLVKRYKETNYAQKS